MRTLLVGLCLSVMFMAAACGKSTPQCSDDDVKKLVIQISHDELKKQLTTQSIITVAHVNPAIWPKIRD